MIMSIIAVTKDEAKSFVEQVDPPFGFFEDQSLGGEVFTESGLLSIINDADEIFFDRKATPALLVVRLGEQRFRFDLVSERNSPYRMCQQSSI